MSVPFSTIWTICGRAVASVKESARLFALLSYTNNSIIRSAKKSLASVIFIISLRYVVDTLLVMMLNSEYIYVKMFIFRVLYNICITLVG